MPEFSDAEAKTLLGAQALLDKLLKNKATKRQTEKLIKTLYPETVTTDDIAEPYVEQITELKNKFEDFVKNQNESKVESKFQQDIGFLMDKRGFSKDGIETLKKLMVEKTIPDIIVAADHWERQNPPQQQTPSTFQPTDWGFGRKTDDTKLLFDDPDRWAEEEASRAWAEETAKKGQIIS